MTSIPAVAVKLQMSESDVTDEIAREQQSATTRASDRLAAGRKWMIECTNRKKKKEEKRKGLAILSRNLQWAILIAPVNRSNDGFFLAISAIKVHFNEPINASQLSQ